MPWIDASRRLQSQGRPVALGQIDECKGQIASIGAELGGRAGAYGGAVTGMSRPRGQIPERCQLTFADDPGRVIAIRANDAADGPVIIRDRTV